MKTTIAPANNPQTLEEWQTACDAADALLELDAARMYGLVEGGPEVDTERCWDVIHNASELHGIEPSEDAVERFVSELTGAGKSGMTDALSRRGNPSRRYGAEGNE